MLELQAVAAAALELGSMLVWELILVLGGQGERLGVSCVLEVQGGAGVHDLGVMAGTIH